MLGLRMQPAWPNSNKYNLQQKEVSQSNARVKHLGCRPFRYSCLYCCKSNRKFRLLCHFHQHTKSKHSLRIRKSNMAYPQPHTYNYKQEIATPLVHLTKKVKQQRQRMFTQNCGLWNGNKQSSTHLKCPLCFTRNNTFKDIDTLSAHTLSMHTPKLILPKCHFQLSQQCDKETSTITEGHFSSLGMGLMQNDERPLKLTTTKDNTLVPRKLSPLKIHLWKCLKCAVDSDDVFFRSSQDLQNHICMNHRDDGSATTIRPPNKVGGDSFTSDVDGMELDLKCISVDQDTVCQPSVKDGRIMTDGVEGDSDKQLRSTITTSNTHDEMTIAVQYKTAKDSLQKNTQNSILSGTMRTSNCDENMVLCDKFDRGEEMWRHRLPSQCVYDNKHFKNVTENKDLAKKNMNKDMFGECTMVDSLQTPDEIQLDSIGVEEITSIKKENLSAESNVSSKTLSTAEEFSAAIVETREPTASETEMGSMEVTSKGGNMDSSSLNGDDALCHSMVTESMSNVLEGIPRPVHDHCINKPSVDTTAYDSSFETAPGNDRSKNRIPSKESDNVIVVKVKQESEEATRSLEGLDLKVNLEIDSRPATQSVHVTNKVIVKYSVCKDKANFQNIVSPEKINLCHKINHSKGTKRNLLFMEDNDYDAKKKNTVATDDMKNHPKNTNDPVGTSQSSLSETTKDWCHREHVLLNSINLSVHSSKNSTLKATSKIQQSTEEIDVDSLHLIGQDNRKEVTNTCETYRDAVSKSEKDADDSIMDISNRSDTDKSNPVSTEQTDNSRHTSTATRTDKQNDIHAVASLPNTGVHQPKVNNGKFRNTTTFMSCLAPQPTQEYDCSFYPGYFAQQVLNKLQSSAMCNQMFHCPVCGLVMRSNSRAAFDHVLSHTKETPFHCRYCKYRKKTSIDMYLHLTNRHNILRPNLPVWHGQCANLGNNQSKCGKNITTGNILKSASEAHNDPKDGASRLGHIQDVHKDHKRTSINTCCTSGDRGCTSQLIERSSGDAQTDKSASLNLNTDIDISGNDKGNTCDISQGDRRYGNMFVKYLHKPIISDSGGKTDSYSRGMENHGNNKDVRNNLDAQNSDCQLPSVDVPRLSSTVISNHLGPCTEIDRDSTTLGVRPPGRKHLVNQTVTRNRNVENSEVSTSERTKLTPLAEQHNMRSHISALNEDVINRSVANSDAEFRNLNGYNLMSDASRVESRLLSSTEHPRNVARERINNSVLATRDSNKYFHKIDFVYSPSRNEEYLWQEIQKHKSKYVFCHLCHIQKSTSDIFNHMHELHEKSQPFHCCECSFTCSTGSKMVSHVRCSHLETAQELSNYFHICNWQDKNSHLVYKTPSHFTLESSQMYHCNACNFQTRILQHILQHIHSRHKVISGLEKSPSSGQYLCYLCKNTWLSLELALIHNCCVADNTGNQQPILKCRTSQFAAKTPATIMETTRIKQLPHIASQGADQTGRDVIPQPNVTVTRDMCTSGLQDVFHVQSPTGKPSTFRPSYLSVKPGLQPTTEPAKMMVLENTVCPTDGGTGASLQGTSIPHKLVPIMNHSHLPQPGMNTSQSLQPNMTVSPVRHQGRNTVFVRPLPPSYTHSVPNNNTGAPRCPNTKPTSQKDLHNIVLPPQTHQKNQASRLVKELLLKRPSVTLPNTSPQSADTKATTSSGHGDPDIADSESVVCKDPFLDWVLHSPNADVVAPITLRKIFNIKNKQMSPFLTDGCCKAPPTSNENEAYNHDNKASAVVSSPWSSEDPPPLVQEEAKPLVN